MEHNKNNPKDQIAKDISVVATQDKMVPKFCTSINVGLLQNKNVILSMVYSESSEHISLIDRVVIDIEHAEQLRNILDKLLEDVKNV